jgi:hypothetical protein
MLTCRVFRRTCIFSAGLLVTGLLLADQAGAVAVAKQTTATAKLIQELKAARALLHRANHDYDGHRAKAIHHVTHAIHALEGTPVPKHHAAKAKGPAVHEPQSVSDAQLQQALQQIKMVQTQLAGGTTASTHLADAVVQLETALKIR